MPTPAPQPTALTLHQASRMLEVGFDDGALFRIPFELMRVYSPSAEVQGHGPGQETLQTGKREVGINDLAVVGHYAVQPSFSDGHDHGGGEVDGGGGVFDGLAHAYFFSSPTSATFPKNGIAPYLPPI